jgi:hypothetical protein
MLFWLLQAPGLIYGTEPALELIEFFVRAVTEKRNQWNCHEGVNVVHTVCDVGVDVHACVHVHDHVLYVSISMSMSMSMSISMSTSLLYVLPCP